jgi:hypothetical protein
MCMCVTQDSSLQASMRNLKKANQTHKQFNMMLAEEVPEDEEEEEEEEEEVCRTHMYYVCAHPCPHVCVFSMCVVCIHVYVTLPPLQVVHHQPQKRGKRGKPVKERPAEKHVNLRLRVNGSRKMTSLKLRESQTFQDVYTYLSKIHNTDKVKLILDGEVLDAGR